MQTYSGADLLWDQLGVLVPNAVERIHVILTVFPHHLGRVLAQGKVLQYKHSVIIKRGVGGERM
jgi:hypothetical protein